MPSEKQAREAFWVRNYERRITDYMSVQNEWVSFGHLDNHFSHYFSPATACGHREFFMKALKRLVKKGVIACKARPRFESTYDHIFHYYSMDPLQKLAVI
jgi:hypothetical protein